MKTDAQRELVERLRERADVWQRTTYDARGWRYAAEDTVNLLNQAADALTATPEPEPVRALEALRHALNERNSGRPEYANGDYESDLADAAMKMLTDAGYTTRVEKVKLYPSHTWLTPRTVVEPKSK